ncbi:MAG: hypothetical protein WBX15_02190 [Thermoanaerobaculia bacterium]
MGAVTVSVWDETQSGHRVERTKLRLISDRVTAADLIEHRIAQEVEEYNRNCSGIFKGLVQPATATESGDSFRMHDSREIDAAAQVRFALDAFRERLLVIAVDDHPILDPDEWTSISTDSSVTFRKLAPLVAG